MWMRGVGVSRVFTLVGAHVVDVSFKGMDHGKMVQGRIKFSNMIRAVSIVRM